MSSKKEKLEKLLEQERKRINKLLAEHEKWCQEYGSLTPWKKESKVELDWYDQAQRSYGYDTGGSELPVINHPSNSW